MVKARKTRSAIVACTMLTGAVLVPIAVTGVLSSAPAAASSTTHKAKLEGNKGGAVEPKAKGKLICSTLTDTWTLSITGIQVIGRDGVTPWDTGKVVGYNPDPGHYYLYVEIGPYLFVKTISQDPTTGLYQANVSDAVPGGTGCGTGLLVQVGGGTATELVSSPGSLVLNAPLS